MPEETHLFVRALERAFFFTRISKTGWLLFYWY
jgi:hypothetical protein